MVRDVSKEESEGQDQRVTCKSKSGGLGGPVGTVSERDAERSIDDERGLEKGGFGVGPGYGQKGKLSLHSGSIPGRDPGSTKGFGEG